MVGDELLQRLENRAVVGDHAKRLQRGNQIALIDTGLARRMRQTMPAKVVGYTRTVTIAWCVFFAATFPLARS